MKRKARKRQQTLSGPTGSGRFTLRGIPADLHSLWKITSISLGVTMERFAFAAIKTALQEPQIRDILKKSLEKGREEISKVDAIVKAELGESEWAGEDDEDDGGEWAGGDEGDDEDEIEVDDDGHNTHKED